MSGHRSTLKKGQSSGIREKRKQDNWLHYASHTLQVLSLHWKLYERDGGHSVLVVELASITEFLGLRPANEAAPGPNLRRVL